MKGKANIADWRQSNDKDIYSIAYSTSIENQQESASNKKGTSIVEPADFETAIAHTGYGKFNYYLLFVTFCTSCAPSFDTAAASYILPFATCELNLSAAEAGFLNSVVFAGMIFSSFFWGFLSDILGRRKLLITSFILDVVMIIGASLAQSLWLMATFRFLSGFMISCPYSVFMAYISEIFSSKYRDKVVMLSGCFFAVGSIIQPALALVIIPSGISLILPGGIELTPWRTFQIVSCLPSLISAITMFYSVESPKFLLEKGRKEEALEVFRTIYKINTGFPQDSYPIKKLKNVKAVVTNNVTVSGEESKLSKLIKVIVWQATTLFKPPYLSKTLITCLLQFGALVTRNIVRLWLPQLFSEVELTGSYGTEGNSLCKILTRNSTEEESCVRDPYTNEVKIGLNSYTSLMYVYAVTLVVNVACNILLKWVPKKILLVTTAVIPGICIILITFVNLKFVMHLAALYLSLLNAYVYVFVAVLVDIFPTSLRATGVSLNIMIGRCGVFVLNILLTELLYSQCYAVFGLLAGMVFAMVIGSMIIPGPVEDESKCDDDTV